MPTALRYERRRLRRNALLRLAAVSSSHALAIAASLVALLALLEWRFDLDVSLGILYVVPVIVAATVLKRWQIFAASVLCAFIRGQFWPAQSPLEHFLRFAMATLAYTATGMLIHEISNSRKTVLSHYTRLRFEQRLRRQAEEQLRLLAESSPAAILTVAANGNVVAANNASHAMLGVAQGQLVGQSVAPYISIFAEALLIPQDVSGIRTSANIWVSRADGTHFPAATWFSIYGEGGHRNLAAILVDTSNEVREREHSHYESLVQHNRVFAGAVSHEIRNLCAAIGVVSSNLRRHAASPANPDVQALDDLTGALSRLASFELQSSVGDQSFSLDLAAMADQVRVVIGQDWEESDGVFEWNVAPDFPPVHAAWHGLLQVLLNLSQNALRAAGNTSSPRLVVQAVAQDDRALLRICDNGPGVSHPERLFQPFQSDAVGSGLGLYVSRAIVKGFGGKLTYAPIAGGGSCFEITLPYAGRMMDVNEHA